MTAPIFRSVEQHTGEVARESRFWPALSEADNLCAELDGLRELQTRLGEVTAERDDLAEKLREGDEAHQITLGRLATANAQLKRMAATR